MCLEVGENKWDAIMTLDVGSMDKGYIVGGGGGGFGGATQIQILEVLELR